jgi:hypothetical protein
VPTVVHVLLAAHVVNEQAPDGPRTLFAQCRDLDAAAVVLAALDCDTLRDGLLAATPDGGARERLAEPLTLQRDGYSVCFPTGTHVAHVEANQPFELTLAGRTTRVFAHSIRHIKAAAEQAGYACAQHYNLAFSRCHRPRPAAPDLFRVYVFRRVASPSLG